MLSLGIKNAKGGSFGRYHQKMELVTIEVELSLSMKTDGFAETSVDSKWLSSKP